MTENWRRVFGGLGVGISPSPCLPISALEAEVDEGAIVTTEDHRNHSLLCPYHGEVFFGGFWEVSHFNEDLISEQGFVSSLMMQR